MAAPTGYNFKDKMTKVIGLQNKVFYIEQSEAEFSAINGRDRFELLRCYHDAELTEKAISQPPWCLEVAKEEVKKKGKK